MGLFSPSIFFSSAALSASSAGILASASSAALPARISPSADSCAMRLYQGSGTLRMAGETEAPGATAGLDGEPADSLVGVAIVDGEPERANSARLMNAWSGSGSGAIADLNMF